MDSRQEQSEEVPVLKNGVNMESGPEPGGMESEPDSEKNKDGGNRKNQDTGGGVVNRHIHLDGGQSIEVILTVKARYVHLPTCHRSYVTALYFQKREFSYTLI